MQWILPGGPGGMAWDKLFWDIFSSMATGDLNIKRGRMPSCPGISTWRWGLFSNLCPAKAHQRAMKPCGLQPFESLHSSDTFSPLPEQYSHPFSKSNHWPSPWTPSSERTFYSSLPHHCSSLRSPTPHPNMSHLIPLASAWSGSDFTSVWVVFPLPSLARRLAWG